MKKKFDIHSWLFEQGGPLEPPATPGQPGQQAPGQPPAQPPQEPQQKEAPGSDNNSAFRSLQGKTISGVTFSANGDSGGVIKIAVKNSYVPFTISWANQEVTISDLSGNILKIGE